MRPIVNIHVDRVVREGAAEPLYIAWTPVLQPDDPDLIHARLSENPYGVNGEGIRQCRLVDGAWRDEGPAPSLSEASWHPDLPDALNGAITIARRVMAAIGHCDRIDVMLENEGDSQSGYVLRSTAVFQKVRDAVTGGPGGMVDDNTLDGIPYVRHVERSGVFAATFFGMRAESDGSGPDATFGMTVTPVSLKVWCGPDEESGIVLMSDLRDGTWVHRTEIHACEDDADVTEVMRRVIDPRRRLRACIDSAGKAEHMVDFDRIVVESVEEPEAFVTTRFSLRPGDLHEATCPED